jgi:Zn-dependent metalloprotease
MNNFTKDRSEQSYFPMFVPPFVLENMARAGIEDAKLTILQSKIFRSERVKLENVKGSMLRAVAPKAGAAGKPAKYIYDSQNTTDLQVKLIRKEDEDPSKDGNVNNAYDFMGDFRDYLMDELNRNSLDDNGMDLIGNVHYDKNFDNAFWDGKQMVFGDGDGKVFINFTTSLDVVAHEMGHGVVQYHANFEYSGQSGALNEHYADVFGSVVTQYVEKQTADTADWLIGDEIMGPELYG